MKTKLLMSTGEACVRETSGAMPAAGDAHSEHRIINILPSKTALTGGAGPYAPMVFHGGPVITAPELISLYWGPFQQSEINTMQGYLAGFAAFLRGQGAPLREEPVVNQYGVVGGIVGATYSVATAPAKHLIAGIRARAPLPRVHKGHQFPGLRHRLVRLPRVVGERAVLRTLSLSGGRRMRPEPAHPKLAERYLPRDTRSRHRPGRGRGMDGG